jgi:pyruvate kinase
MIKIKKTKIVATLGPATESKKIKAKMIKNGVNVFRINFSHADYDTVAEQIQQIRELEEELETPIAILADLQGPKLRIGKVEDGTILQEGDTLTLSTKHKITTNNLNKEAYITYKQLPCDVKPGEIILVDDGKIQLQVQKTNKKDTVVTKVIEGGPLSSKKGVNLPNTNISLPALTKKDKKDLLFAIEMQVDWVALSFVRSADDVKLIKSIIKKHSDYNIPVISKIEKPEAVQNINEIIEVTDGLMVARGDLGIEVPLEQVPLIQKKLVYLAKKHQKPIIIATQMMESMITGSIPTRAEVNDVANSVMDGADAVMLSGETSVGKNPVKVIKQITKIILQVENSNLIKLADWVPIPEKRDERFISEVICYNASEIARDVSASVITTFTSSGFSAYKISARRPMAYILVFTAHHRLMRSLVLVWGVMPFYYDKLISTDDTIKDIEAIAKKNNFVQSKDMMVSIFSMPISKKGMVNTLRITQVD